MKTELVIKVDSEIEWKAVSGALLSIGLKCYQGVTNVDEMARRWYGTYGKAVIIERDRKNFTHSGGSSGKMITLKEALVELEESLKNVEVKLNDNYTAIVEKDTVCVGCQTFTFDKVLELADEVRKRKG